jgi:TetR/AcrR family transcriptional repressor of nem operon
MRRSREDSAETRRRIVAEASRQFRAQGIARVGVADVMGALGLTVGGFYRHFSSKDALVAEAIDAASLETTERHARTAPAALVTTYLSREHCDAPARGCPVAALCSEMSHETPAARAAFTRALVRLLETARSAAPGDSARERDARLRAAASLVGAVVLARACDDAKLGADLLAAVRAGLLPAQPPRTSRARGHAVTPTHHARKRREPR